jgi:hypothetical protein
MADATTATHEGNIWAVFAMGYASDIGPIRSGKVPRQSFLKELQSLHVYGRFQLNQIHLRGLIQLVMLIGGIQNIRTPGMASVISLCVCKVSNVGALANEFSADLFESSRNMRHTFMPFIPFTNAYLLGDRLAFSTQERLWARQTLPRLGKGFLDVWQPTDPVLTAILAVMDHMVDFTMIVENYIRGRVSPRPGAALTDQRNFTQHALMSLPTAREIETNTGQLCDDLYEPCRLALLVYSFLVVFPFPPIIGLHEKITSRLQRSIVLMKQDLQFMGQSRLRFHLWILTMGAIISIGLPQRTFYIVEIRKVVPMLGLKDEDAFSEVLERFLWHPKTSRRDGQDLWRDVEG